MRLTAATDTVPAHTAKHVSKTRLPCNLHRKREMDSACARWILVQFKNLHLPSSSNILLTPYMPSKQTVPTGTTAPVTGLFSPSFLRTDSHGYCILRRGTINRKELARCIPVVPSGRGTHELTIRKTGYIRTRTVDLFGEQKPRAICLHLPPSTPTPTICTNQNTSSTFPFSIS